MQDLEMSAIGQDLPLRSDASLAAFQKKLPGRARRVTMGWLAAGLGLGLAGAAWLGRQSIATRGKRARAFKIATATTAGVTLLDALFLARSARLVKPRPIAVKTSVTIRRSRDELYSYWRDLRNLAGFMRHVDSVTELNGHSVWRARGPAGVSAEWEAEVVADRPGERIAWRSLENATVPHHGSVVFRDAPGDQGTEVHLEIAFEPPAGVIGEGIVRMFHIVPEESMKNDLRRLKQIMETGEIVCSDASIHAGPHPARPPKLEETPLVHGMVRS